MSKRHLIIGAGPAGMSAVDTIREFGDEGPITLVTDEQPYSRMVLPYLMDGTIPEENVFTADDEYLAAKAVQPLIGKRVTSLDPSGKATLDDGSTIDFDNALIATGSTATRPPIEGADGRHIFNLWTLDDARAVLERKGGEVVVIGAGFIAFTCLDALAALGSRLTVVEVEERILPRMIDETGASMVRSYLEEKGVAFRTATRVSAIEDSGERKHLVVEDGDDLEADVVVMATGIRPNLEVIEGLNLDVDFGIVVDDHLRTKHERVYAGGDVAQGPVVGGDAKEVHAIQPTALEHGRIAGANMAGKDLAYWGSLLMNIVDVQNLHVASFGDWEGEGAEVRTVENDRRPVYRKLIFRDDRLTGAVFLGRPDDVTMLNDMGMVKGLIQTQSELGEWRTYLDKNPLDVRRPYVASRAAERLLEMQLLSKPSDHAGYRQPDPSPQYWEHHETFVGPLKEQE
jgi:NAD(P)H-nitrite reductase large subunit